MTLTDRELELLVIINALRRGVGIHHAGMPRRYRVLVENLCKSKAFLPMSKSLTLYLMHASDRRGVLRVVISTQTLALGINAPARTWSVSLPYAPILGHLLILFFPQRVRW